MSGFNTSQQTAAPLPDELDKKIEVMNNYLVEGREEFKKILENKAVLEKEIADLGEKKSVLKSEVVRFEDRCEAVQKIREEIDSKMGQAKAELILENQKLVEAKKQVEVEEEKSRRIVAGLEQREKDVVDKESTMRVYAKSLEEKEKKLDEYQAKVKRFVDNLKS